MECLLFNCRIDWTGPGLPVTPGALGSRIHVKRVPPDRRVTMKFVSYCSRFVVRSVVFHRRDLSWHQIPSSPIPSHWFVHTALVRTYRLVVSTVLSTHVPTCGPYVSVTTNEGILLRVFEDVFIPPGRPLEASVYKRFFLCRTPYK